MKQDRSKIYLSLVVIIFLAAFLAYALRPHINAFFGAFIFFILFSPVNRFFVEKLRFNKTLSAILIILGSVLIVVIPASVIITAALGEAGTVMDYSSYVLERIDAFDESFPQYDVRGQVKEQISQLDEFLSSLLFRTVQGFSRATITLIILYFLLYYLLVNYKTVQAKSLHLIPFSRKNSLILYKEFRNVTYSTVVTTGLIAVLQGGLLTAGFLILKVPGAFFWGFLGAFLSFLPVVGITLIWIPAGVIYLLQGNWFVGIAILVWGFFLSNVDNLIRPFIQLKVGKMHPLVSLIGIFIGLPFFGLLGIVVGPLLLSYFLLAVKMFKEEYL